MPARPSPWLVWIPLALAVVLGALWLASTRSAGFSQGADPFGLPASGEAFAGGGVEGVDPLPLGPREPIPLDRAEPVPMRVYMSPTCGCCSVWVDHMEEHGFEVESLLRNDMGQVKAALGVPSTLSSCHTGVVNGYVIEGHVPASDVRAFLAEAPEARGLTVPGMPIGSPGMEYGDHVDPYDVLVLEADGSTTVYRSYGR
jgi:hypothetical protein